MFCFKRPRSACLLGGEEKPSVECPVGDFFCCGFGVDCTVNSLPMVVNLVRGFHCYFQMPFKKHAKITIENQHPADIGGFFYQIDYNLKEVPENAGYFMHNGDVSH